MYEKKVTILLPTYNEANNIAPLLYALKKSLAGTNTEYEILIIDDSTDQTPQEIKKLSEIYPEMRYIHRSEESRTGLATAFVKGFGLANGKYILCMDSDLQHPPEVVPRLIEAIEASENDMIIATRYRTGGGADGLGSLYRKFASRVCRMLAWVFLPQTRKTTDPGSGFFIMQQDLIKDVSFGGLRGFKILIDILSRTPWSRVSEVPYVFRKRENEESKATLKQGYQFILHLFHLRKQTIELVYEEKRREKEYIKGNGYAIPISIKRDRLRWGDIFFVLGIALVGWFLIGYYTGFKFLYTGYEDWIYHAFRVQSLSLHGIPSWDHVWANGINHWRLYQYIQHFFVLGVVKLTGFSITTVFIYTLVSLYIGFRIAIYLSLRLLGVNYLFSLVFVLLSYTMVQEWGSMQDYSIYLSFFVVPFYIFFWIKSFFNPSLVYILTAITGALWTVHPVLGFSLSILLGFLVIFSGLKNSFKRLFFLAIIYFLSAVPFLVQYFTSGYIFTNPIFKSSIYLTTSLIPVSHGLSFLYWVFFVISWILLIIKSHRIALWVKVLFLYCSFYLLLIFLGQNSFIPDFLIQFQFSRALPIIGFILVYCFALIFFQSFGNIRGRSIVALFVGLAAVIVSNAIEVSSGFYVAPATNSIENPVALYFQDHELPRGSVYFDNVSEASYFAPQGIRYATSYNEHAQPHPYSTRLRMLLRQSIAYTGLSQKHIESIENYSTVLGIEYLFLPSSSPLVTSLTGKDNSFFNKVEELESIQLADSISVLKYTYPIHYAFVFEREDIPNELMYGDINLPTLHASSYEAWDTKIADMAGLLRQGKGFSLPLTFVDTDKLSLNLDTYQKSMDFQHPILLLNQSYDHSWKITNAEYIEIQPTPLRLMQIDISELGDNISILEFVNRWPDWHWPLQATGLAMIFLTVMHYFFLGRKKLS